MRAFWQTVHNTYGAVLDLCDFRESFGPLLSAKYMISYQTDPPEARCDLTDRRAIIVMCLIFQELTIVNTVCKLMGPPLSHKISRHTWACMSLYTEFMHH